MGMVTSCHVTKMAVTPFDPQWPKTPRYKQTARLYLLYNRELLPIEVLHCGNREFRVSTKNSGNYQNFLFAPQKRT